MCVTFQLKSMRTFKFILLFFITTSILFLIITRDKKDVVVFPDGLSNLSYCDANYKGRVVAFYKSPLESNFVLDEMMRWNYYYSRYSPHIDFCFIIEQSDTVAFKTKMDQMGFLLPFHFDYNASFSKKYDYQFIAFITDRKNHIIAISNPSLGKAFEDRLLAMID
jgi:hypothetical protein